MVTNERGVIFMPLLFMTALLLIYVMGQMPQTLVLRENARDEWGKWQAERNAEAGVYLALGAWKDDPEHFVGDDYALSNGQVRVTVERHAEDVIKIISKASSDSVYKDELSVLYDTEQNRWIDWTR